MCTHITGLIPRELDFSLLEGICVTNESVRKLWAYMLQNDLTSKYEYTSQERARIWEGMPLAENSPANSATHFSQVLDCKEPESTMRLTS